jgi:hypothetical protein
MPYNNFIFKVNLATPIAQANFKTSNQPFTTTPTDGTTTFIFRISNPKAVGVNSNNRVENEIAALFLSREALSRVLPQYAGIVPRIFDWSAQVCSSPLNESEFGWTIMETLSGVPLDSQFDNLPFAEQKELLNEIAGIFAVIQNITLPEGARSFGGLTIKAGEIVSGQSTIAMGGPWNDYSGWWTGLYAMALSQAENSPVVRGWRDDGLRERVNKFISNGIESLLQDVDTSKLVLVHGDFSKHTPLAIYPRVTEALTLNQPQTTSSIIPARSESQGF